MVALNTTRISLFVALSLLSLPAQAARREPESHALPPCAVIREASGAVQVLDSSRTKVTEAVTDAPVECGSWLSISEGFVRMRHREGYELHFSAGSFVEFPDYAADAKKLKDHVVLYRGQAYVSAEGGSPELRVLTANGRALFKRGSSVVVYDRHEHETQLIAVDGSAVLENRFDSVARMKVQAGEATSLNLDLQRVVPTAPRAVAIAALRGKLQDLMVNEKELKEAVRTALDRHERKVASRLEEFDRETERRAPASAKSAYSRPALTGEDAMLKRKFAERIVGGAPMRVPASKVEEIEKRRLIEELSKIREE